MRKKIYVEKYLKWLKNLQARKLHFPVSPNFYGISKSSYTTYNLV